MVFTVGPEWPVLPQVLIAVGAFGLIVGILTLIARAWRPLHSLYRGIRQDWTRLSFGLFTGMLVLFGGGGIDFDEDPIFTLNVFMPSLIVLAGALIYLRSTTKAQRILALLVRRKDLLRNVWGGYRGNRPYPGPAGTFASPG
jgi:hypothetical protein